MAASLLVCAQLVLALSMKPSFPLTAFGDLASAFFYWVLCYLFSRLPSTLTGEPGFSAG